MNASGLIAGVKHPYAEPRFGHGFSRKPAPGFWAPARYPAAGQSLPKPGRKPKAVRTTVAAGMFCLGLLTAGTGFHRWRETGLSTDQARIERDSYPVSSPLEATIAKIYVSNGQFVRAGDLLVEMDHGQLEAALAAAHAEALEAQTTMPAVTTRLANEQAELEKVALTMRHRERELDEAMLDDDALREAQARKRVSPARWRPVQKAYEAALSRYSEAKAVLDNAIDRVRSDQALRDATAAKLRASAAAIEQTERQLSNTRVYATADGRVAFDKSKVSQRLRAGEAFLSIVGEPWVMANFNRRQLERLKPGQRVRTRIAAIKERAFPGRVASVGSRVTRAGAERGPGPTLLSGLFPALQTVPVRITLDPDGLLGFEDRMELGLASSVKVVAK
jgi:membrane fusion protein, multidrug efflux system